MKVFGEGAGATGVLAYQIPKGGQNPAKGDLPLCPHASVHLDGPGGVHMLSLDTFCLDYPNLDYCTAIVSQSRLS